MSMKKYSKEVPGDLAGQKTTAVPIEEVATAEWVTPVHVVSEGNGPTAVVLQDAATAAGNGTAFLVGSAKELTIEITGTSTSRTVVFEAASVSGTYYPITGVKTSDLSMGSQTTGTAEVWNFTVTGQVSFRARVSAVAGGNVSVKGNAI